MAIMGTRQTVTRPDLDQRAEILRFLDRRTERNGACWEWQGCLNVNGYGKSYIPGLGRKAVHLVHRAGYYATYGRWPLHDLEHLCHNRRCWNPSHLADCPATVNRSQGARNGWRFRAELKKLDRGLELAISLDRTAE